MCADYLCPLGVYNVKYQIWDWWYNATNVITHKQYSCTKWKLMMLGQHLDVLGGALVMRERWRKVACRFNLACMTMGGWRCHSAERKHEGRCHGEKTSKSCALDISEHKILGDQPCGWHRISQNCTDSPYGHYSITLFIIFDTSYTTNKK